MRTNMQSGDIYYNTTIFVGTLDELSGCGEEWLVDRATRSCVLARFLNGNFITMDLGLPTLDASQAPTKIAA
jgi:hypothetical protein